MLKTKQSDKINYTKLNKFYSSSFKSLSKDYYEKDDVIESSHVTESRIWVSQRIDHS